MGDPRISQLLPTVKCSSCNADVEFRKLGEHICSAAPPLPPLPMKYAEGRNEKSNNRSSPPSSSATSKNSDEITRSPDGSQSKPSLPFLSKYKNLTGKSNEPMKSPISPPQKSSPDDYFPSDYSKSRAKTPDPLDTSARSDRYGDRLDNRGYGEKEKERAPTPTRLGSDDAYSASRRNDDYKYEQPAKSPGLRSTNDRYDRYDDYSRSPRSPDKSPGGYDYGDRYSPQDNYKKSGRDPIDSIMDNMYGDRFDESRRPSKDNDRYDRRQLDQRRPSNQSGGPLDSLMDDLMKDIDDDYGRPSVESDRRPSRSCHICGKGIDRRDEVVNMDRRTFHRACYSCTSCGSRFDDRHPSREHEGKFYCERDYYIISQPPARICAVCDAPITGETPIKALGQYYHPGHLKCHECRRAINPKQGLVEHKGKVFCREDFTNLYLPKCRACGLAVEKEAVTSSDGQLDGKWHKECFGCHTCRKPFPDSTFYVFENAPYCRRHYHKLNNSLCRTCDDPIEGPCAQTIEGWRFHPNCFTCAVCRVPITDTYYQYDNKTYCETHIKELQKQRKVKAEKRQTYFKRI